MSTYIKRGDSLFIPFKNGRSISDSQCKPRMYKSKQNFEKTFPKHNYGTSNIELVEYTETKYAEWYYDPNGMDWGLGAWLCSECHTKNDNIGCSKNISPYMFAGSKFCPQCGATMKKGITDEKSTF